MRGTRRSTPEEDARFDRRLALLVPLAGIPLLFLPWVGTDAPWGRYVVVGFAILVSLVGLVFLPWVSKVRFNAGHNIMRAATALLFIIGLLYEFKVI